MLLIRCFLFIEERSFSTSSYQTLAFPKARWPNRRQSIPLQWQDSLWRRGVTHTHTDHTCLPKDSPNRWARSFLITPAQRNPECSVVAFSQSYVRINPHCGAEWRQTTPAASGAHSSFSVLQDVHTVSLYLIFFFFLLFCLSSFHNSPFVQACCAFSTPRHLRERHRGIIGGSKLLCLCGASEVVTAPDWL